jgi:hypothetical protein
MRSPRTLKLIEHNTKYTLPHLPSANHITYAKLASTNHKHTLLHVTNRQTSSSLFSLLPGLPAVARQSEEKFWQCNEISLY